MTFDAAKGFVLLFGGNNSTGSVQSTTWEFKTGVWTKIVTAHSPSARWIAPLAYDAYDNYPLLFGGFSGAGTVLGDTWNFTGTDWHQLTPTSSPLPRAGAGSAYSPSDASVVLFGGYLGPSYNRFASDTWLFKAGAWTKKVTFVHPYGRYLTTMADGVAGGFGTVMIGGYGSLNPNDVWTYKSGSWLHLIPSAPAPRAYPAMAWDDHDHYVVLFGGQNLTTGVIFGDTWKFVGGVWAPIPTSTAPAARVAASMVYDATDGYLVLFGGSETGLSWNMSCGTWTFQGRVWTEILATCVSQPTPRYLAMMAYDAYDGYVLLFGGVNYTASQFVMNDTWSFSGGAWTFIDGGPSGTGAPPAEYSGAMTYDSADAAVVLFGGVDANYNTLNTTWIYLAGSWSNYSYYAGGMLQLTAAMMTDDSGDGYTLLFGGYNPILGAMDFSYSFSPWSFLSVGSPPPELYGAGIAYDPIDGYAVLFGGVSYYGATTGQTWTYVG